MATLLEKKPRRTGVQPGMDMPADSIQRFMNSCFPDIKNHALYDAHRFKQLFVRDAGPAPFFNLGVV